MPTVTIATVNGKVGSIVITSSTTTLMPEYFLNLKNCKVGGDNPFLPGGSTLNPQASLYIMDLDSGYKLWEGLLSNITLIGGVATPATLALALAALAALIAE